MEYIEAVNKDGHVIKVKPIIQRKEVTSLDSTESEFVELVIGVLIDGQKQDLNLDNSFYYPPTEQYYIIKESI